MSPRQQIAHLLQQWREISQSELVAIHAGDWPQMRILQAAKENIQRHLTQARYSWNADNPSDPLPSSGEHPFVAEVSSLIALETRKTQLLEARRQKLRDRQTLLRRARHNVRRVRNSYAGQTPPKWHSYS